MILTFEIQDEVTGNVDSAVQIKNIALGKVFDGKTGDIVTLNIGETYGNGNNFLNLVTSEWNKAGEIFLAEALHEQNISALNFRENGIFYFAPKVNGSEVDENANEQGFQGELFSSVDIDSVTRWLSLEIEENFTTDGEGAVTFEGQKLDIARAQQRLNYLGFTGNFDFNANKTSSYDVTLKPLDINGELNNATKHAIKLFNTAVSPSQGGDDYDTSLSGSDLYNELYDNTITTKKEEEKKEEEKKEEERKEKENIPGAAIQVVYDKMFEDEFFFDSSFNTYGKVFINDNNAPYWEKLELTNTGYTTFREGNQTERWATSWTKEILEQGALLFNEETGENLQMNGVSLPIGGYTPFHKTHEAGMDLDIEIQPDFGATGYDQEKAREQLLAFSSLIGFPTNSGATIEGIFFNDPETHDIPGVRAAADHSDHMHVDVLGPQPASLTAEYTFTGLTGDVIKIDLKETFGDQFTSFDLSGIDYLEKGGTVILDNNFASNGVFYFAPDINNPLSSIDIDPNSRGFQGTLTGQVLVSDNNGQQLKLFEIAVDSGYSLDTGAMTGENNQVDLRVEKARVQQRLNYFGFVDFQENPLKIDGKFGNLTFSAIKRFKGAIDSNINSDPDNEDSTVDEDTLDWLNRLDAPRWTQLFDTVFTDAFDLRDGGNFFGTNWVIDTIQTATSNHPGTQVIYEIASQKGPNQELGGAGKSFEIQVDASVATESSGNELTEAEQDVVDLLEVVWQASHTAQVARVLHSNSKIINAFNQRIGTSVGVVDFTFSNRFHVDFNPPSGISINSDDISLFMQGFAHVGDVFEQLNNTNILSQSLPFVGATLENTDLDLTLGNSLNFSEIFQENILNPISDYLSTDTTPSVTEISTVLGEITPPDLSFEASELSTNSLQLTNNSVDSSIDGLFIDPLSIRNTVTEEEVSYSFHLYGQQTLNNVALDFSQIDNDWLLSFDAEAQVDLVVNVNLDFTFGYDPSSDLTPEQAFFIKIDNFNIGGGVEVDDLDLGLNISFLDTNVVDGHLNLTTDVDIVFDNPNQDSENKITIAELLGTETDTLIYFDNPSLSVDAHLPVQVNLTGFETNADITVTGDIFSSDPLDFSITGSLLEDLQNFTRLSPLQITNAFVQFGNWLESNGHQDLLDQPIPFLENQTFADLLNFANLLEEDIFGNFVDENGDPLFDNIADFTDLLSDLIGKDLEEINARYDKNSDILSFDFSHAKVFAQDSSIIDLNLDLGVIAELESSSHLSYSVQGETDFTIGFDLSPYDARLTGEQALPGDGKLSDDAVFTLSVNGTAAIEVTVEQDLSHVNRNQLIEDINFALQEVGLEEVSASLLGDKLTLSTQGNLSGASLLILEVNEIAANELGLQEVGVTDNLGDRVLFSNINLTTSADLVANEIDAQGQLALIEFEIIDGSLNGNVEAQLSVHNPNASNAPIILSDLFDNILNLDDFTNVSFAGTASLDFPTIEVTDNILGVVDEELSAHYSWTNIFETGTITDTVSSAFEQLSAYADITEEKILEALSSLADFFDSLANGSLGNNLPLFDVSLSDLADLGTTIRTTVQELNNDPEKATVISAIEDKLETAIAKALDISPEEDIVELSLAQTELQFSLNYMESNPFSEDLTIDLSGLGVEALADLIDVSGGTKLDGELTTAAHLIFGFELGQNSLPRPYLHEDTSLELGLKAIADDIEFTAAIGPLGVFIKDYPGSELEEAKEAIATIGLGNDLSTLEPATINLSLLDITNDKYYLDTISFNDFTIETVGQAYALLPTFYLLESEYQGDIELAADLSNGAINLTHPDFANFIESLDVEKQIDVIVDGVDELLTQVGSGCQWRSFRESLSFFRKPA